ncbi:ribosomal protein L26 [Acrasis kona]|uniref:Ribosomal protein L26 n=1 Tax=Acrasis kona TaxID=1008807 RepID=A0AAW2Z9T6_9EUKA
MVCNNPVISSSRRKARKAHFTAPSSERRIIMSSTLSAELRKKYNVRAVPIRRGDEVEVLVGRKKTEKGKVKKVYRKKFQIFVEGIQTKKVNGQEVDVALHPSNVKITALHLDKDRKALLARKAAARRGGKDEGKGKHTEDSVVKA